MKNNYFAMKAKMSAINKNLRTKHPDWDSKRIYAATKAIATGEKTALPELTPEEAEAAAEAVEAISYATDIEVE